MSGLLVLRLNVLFQSIRSLPKEAPSPPDIALTSNSIFVPVYNRCNSLYLCGFVTL